jgi:hypothetical protein
MHTFNLKYIGRSFQRSWQLIIRGLLAALMPVAEGQLPAVVMPTRIGKVIEKWLTLFR